MLKKHFSKAITLPPPPAPHSTIFANFSATYWCLRTVATSFRSHPWLSLSFVSILRAREVRVNFTKDDSGGLCVGEWPPSLNVACGTALVCFKFK